MDAPGNPVDEARCPRCGYDVRATASTWARSCPLEGRCTECGLVFRWCEVLRPEKFEPKWLIEYARFVGVMAAARRTALRSLRPWRFWSRVRMSQPVRPWRLVLYVALLLLAVVASYAFEQVAVATRVRWTVAADKNAITVNQSYAEAILEAVLTPRRKLSAGSVTYKYSRRGRTFTTTQRYPPPDALHETIWATSRGRASRWWLVDEWIQPLVHGWLTAVAIYAAVPLTFVLLPVSRRRARVRWAHVARVAAYSAALPLLLASAYFVATGLAYLWPAALIGTLRFLGWCFAIGLPLFLVVWWASAVRRYLKMPNGLAVAILMVVLSTLVLSVTVPPIQEMFIRTLKAAIIAF